MKNLFVLLALVFSFTAVAADPVVSTSAAAVDGDEKPFDHRKSHWVSGFGFESTKREIAFDFQGTKKNFTTEDRELYGGRLYAGYEVYVPGGFLIGGGVSAYYFGTAFQDAKEAIDPATNNKFTEENNRAQMLGAEAYGHFGWMFDFKTKNPFLGEMTYMAMELFGEATVGRGESYFRKDYFYETSVNESYDTIITDTFTSASVSGGVNFLSRTSGFYLTLKATTMLLDIDKQRTTRANASGGTTSNTVGSVENPDTDPITIFTLGGGYKF